ncbi:MAG TPA: helix-turn-helix domain-containing protein [Gaiellales bacterium]|nr:helix-turn-helix domain-containing protein [Gaiellales bacterium]
MEASRIVSLAAAAPPAGAPALTAPGVHPDYGAPTVLPLPLLTKEQIARHYGMSVRWVEYQLAKGMPSRMIGGRRRFELDAVDGWLRANCGGR